jgi:hypothetical protein
MVLSTDVTMAKSRDIPLNIEWAFSKRVVAVKP